MRFYDPATNPPDRYHTEDLFPTADEDTAARKCLKMGLLPSVTTVLGSLREVYLEEWKMRESVKVGRIDLETSPSDIVRRLQDEDSPNSGFGTEVHNTIECFLKGEPVDVSERAKKHAAPAIAWLKENMAEVLHSETTLADADLKSAGTIDSAIKMKDGRYVLGDLKVVKFSTKYPPHPGLAYKMQLSAYENMLAKKTGRNYERLSMFLASPFGWDKAPRLLLFWHKKCHLASYKALREVWEAQLSQGPEDYTTVDPAKELVSDTPAFDPLNFRKK